MNERFRGDCCKIYGCGRRGLGDAYAIRSMLARYESAIETGGLRGAGMAIGIIERVLVDRYTAITIVFAAKSIARFE